MPNTDYIPRSDEQFNSWVINLLRYISFHSSEWNVPEDAFNTAAAMLDPWKEAFANASNPEMRTKAVVNVKIETKKTFVAEIRRVVKAFIAYNPFVSDSDRDNMSLPVHKTTRTPVPPPTTIPEFRVDTGIIRRLTIHFQAAGSKTKAKPAGIHGCEVKWGVLAAPPASVDDLSHSSFDTNSPLTLEFGEPERGKSVYFCLRWENTRGEKGPWSEIAMAIIP